MNDDYRLMIPGPIEVSNEVLRWMGMQVQPHYGDEWLKVHHETVALMQEVLYTDGDIFLIPGSGSAGLDAGLGSLILPGSKAIIGVNGFFGERLAIMAGLLGAEVIAVEATWGQPLTPSDFASPLQTHSDAAVVAVVHIETSTGVVNPIADIARGVKAKGIPFMVDAVSSAGGIELFMDDWGVDICTAASQKGLGAPPGLALVAVGPGGWEAIKNRPGRNHGWYLNLEVWRQYAEEWADWHPFPITMATSIVLALRAALQELLRDGLATRIAHYQALADQLRAGLADLGLRQLPPPRYAAPIITAVFGPPGVDTGEIVQYFAKHHHIKIAGGMGQLKGHIIRIGHMGTEISSKDIDHVIEALREFSQ